MDLIFWQPRLRALASQPGNDSAHDLAHIDRVAATATRLARLERADISVVIPAAYLHDCVQIAKSSPDRARASNLAADRAVSLLRDAGYPARLLEAIHHCIEAHSFSAAIKPTTLEAKVVQDADRLDALGAIGIARCFATPSAREFYSGHDPFCKTRTPDDARYTLDHFYSKLLRLPDSLQTASALDEARDRTAFMNAFLVQLASELDPLRSTPH
jgi:uncharacterized protein